MYQKILLDIYIVAMPADHNEHHTVYAVLKYGLPSFSMNRIPVGIKVDRIQAQLKFIDTLNTHNTVNSIIIHDSRPFG